MTAIDATRKAELAKIHIARGELALEEDSYRAIVRRFSKDRTDSSAKLSPAERHAVLDHFTSLGFKPKGRPETPAPAGRHADPRLQVKKLKALWLSLWQLGAVSDPGDEALGAFVARETGVQVMRWNDGVQLNAATNCLKGWCRRVGYSANPFHGKRPTLGEGRFEPVLIEAQWARLVKLGAPDLAPHATLATWMGNEGFRVRSVEDLEREDAAEIVKRLGKWLRRVARGKPEVDDGPDD